MYPALRNTRYNLLRPSITSYFRRPSQEGSQITTTDPQLALQYAASVARRVRDRETPVRWSFIRTFESGTAPMAQMLRGGRGGSVRLKLYLAFLWFAVSPPHDVSYPARAWAGLLGLDDPEGNGARRITDAIAWLAEHDFVRADRQRGRPTRVYLRLDDGSGAPYELPGATLERLNEEEAEKPALLPWFYVRLPIGFWTNGWVTILNGPAIAMLLALLQELGDRDPSSALWFSPSEAVKRFGLSEDTRSAGFRQLAELGVITVGRRSVNRDVFDFRRVRNVYTLDVERLQSLPPPTTV